MSQAGASTTALQLTLSRFGRGDASALDELLRHSQTRLTTLASRMLGDYPGVRRWCDTGDVLQNALLRLLRSLEQVRPASPREFLGLATLQIRRELIDLARHYYGPQGQGAHHDSHGGDSQHAALQGPADDRHEPGSLAEWCEFHQRIDLLPEEQRDVVSLLYYQGLSQTEAADVLGVSLRTLQRRWHAAAEELHRLWHG